jgi:hypothetical protein
MLHLPQTAFLDVLVRGRQAKPRLLHFSLASQGVNLLCSDFAPFGSFLLCFSCLQGWSLTVATL